MIALDDCQSYLQEICHRYEQWWAENSLTEAIAARQATFSFEQMVQTEEKDSEGKPKKITLPIFRAIRNYVESEHILLVGSPGVGKSTALLRCLVHLAEREREKPEPQIPILISLKRYNSNRFSCPEDPSGILTLIKDTLEPDIWLEVLDIKKLLFKDKRLILLLDGLNEMSAGEKRTELEEFRKKCDRSKVPLICTTRELGGGDLGIKRKLEIQPLRSEEIERFLQDCIPAQTQKVLQLLNRDNRELSRTPFVLWMLYDLFQKQGTEVETLAEAFRKFFESFQKFKESVPVSNERRKAWNRWLEHLAFTVLNNPDPTEPGLVISKEQAEKNLIEKFGSLYGASSRIEELLDHHLLEPISEKEVSFQHQLIQEYYAAECLLTELPDLLKKQPEQEYTSFQMNYLNYVKWTEAIALMLGLPEVSNSCAEHLVELALDTDLMLGARLAGEVKPQFQEQTVEVLNQLMVQRNLPEWLKIELLEETQSEEAIEILSQVIEQEGAEARWQAIEALGKIRSENAVKKLIQFLLKSSDPLIRRNVANELGQLSSEATIPALIIALKDDPDSEVRWKAAYALGEIGSEKAIFGLCAILRNLDSGPEVRWKAAYALGEIGLERALPELLAALKDLERLVRFRAVEALGKIGSKDVIPQLLELAEKDPDYSVRQIAWKSLNKIRQGKEAIDATHKAIQKLYSDRQQQQADSLEQHLSTKTLDEILNEINNPDPNIRQSVVKALGQRDFSQVVHVLINVLKNDSNSNVCWSAAKVLYQNGTDEAIKALLSALEDNNYMVRVIASEALGRVENDSTAQYLPHLLTLIFSNAGEETFSAIESIQSRCGFYNYEIAQAKLHQSMKGRSEENLLYDKLDTLTQEVKKMSEEPKRIIYTQSYFEKGTHTHTHNYANDETLKQEITDLRQLVSQLQQNHQPATEVEAIQVIDAEFHEIQKTNPNLWQAIQKQLNLLKRQLLNPERHLTASKAAIAEVAKHYLEESVVAKALITYLDTMSTDTDQGK